MCNRYQTAKDIERLRTIFANAPANWFDETDKKYDTFYPKSNVPVVLMVEGAQKFMNFQWGIHPVWAKTKSQLLTNSKCEEVLVKPTWKESFRRRRCLMPATAFYEPATVEGKKHQVRFELKSGSPFAFAGLWQKSHDGSEINCCSLLTCEPNSIVGEIHGRMPVILPTELFEYYLKTPPEEVEDLLEILRPYPAEDMVGTFDREST
jgi:putative SOS response-associated peptidase YedK